MKNKKLPNILTTHLPKKPGALLCKSIAIAVFYSILSAKTALYAQEVSFSHYYQGLQHQNPAFAGNTYFIEGTATSRATRPYNNGKAIVNTLLTGDIKLINQYSGLGVYFHNLSNALEHNKLQLNYSYAIRLKDLSWMKLGLGISYNQRSTPKNGFKFPDQYNNSGFTGNATSELSIHDKSNFTGLSTGFVAYKQFSWFGASVNYLNQPTENFAGYEQVYPMKFSLHGGFIIPFNKNVSSKRRFTTLGGIKPFSGIGPVVNYVQQWKYMDFNIGMAYFYKQFYTSSHYRYWHDLNLSNTKDSYRALVVLLGYRQEDYSLSYSYDAALSNKTINRNGTHEICISFKMAYWLEDYKRINLIPTPNRFIY